VPVVEQCRKHGVSEASIYTWKPNTAASTRQPRTGQRLDAPKVHPKKPAKPETANPRSVLRPSFASIEAKFESDEPADIASHSIHRSMDVL
jgi:hypothetical protein